MSMNATDPSELFGGSWLPLDEGRVLIGCNSSYPANSKGGEFTHTLTIDEMPAHTHASANSTTEISSYSDMYRTVARPGGNSSSAGGGQAHNNMQPYLAVYMWYRTE